jgi:phenylpyruvate tautomerase PptA (4-oxalocrotonate tautomerase family)
MSEVYVHAVEGRSPEQKKALMKDITDAVGQRGGFASRVLSVVDSPHDEAS